MKDLYVDLNSLLLHEDKYKTSKMAILRVMLTCALRAHVKKSKRKNIL